MRAGEEIATHYETREYVQAMRLIMGLADRTNQYVDEAKPWVLAKEAGREKEIQAICTQALNLFRVLTVYLKPVLPRLAEKVEVLFAAGSLSWDKDIPPLLGQCIQPFQNLMNRIDPSLLQAMLEDSMTDLQPTTSSPLRENPLAAPITLEGFAQVDLRITRIIKAEHIPNADKLLRLTLDLGGEIRTVFAGIKLAYDPATLEGRLTVMVANLTPRKMHFGLSEGMVLAAGPGGQDIFLLSPDNGAKPGMRVK